MNNGINQGGSTNVGDPNLDIGAVGGAGGDGGAGTAPTPSGLPSQAGINGATGSSGINGGNAGANGLIGTVTDNDGAGGASTIGQSAGPTFVGEGQEGEDAPQSGGHNGVKAADRNTFGGAMDGVSKTDQATKYVNFSVDADGRIGAITVDSGAGGLGGAGGVGGDGGHGGGGGGGGGDGATSGETNGPSWTTVTNQSYGHDGGGGGRGQAGGNGGDGGSGGHGSAGAKGQSVDITILDNVSTVLVTGVTGLAAGDGAAGGAGGSGGSGGSGGRGGTDSLTASGSHGWGGIGGNGGNGAVGGNGADGGAAGDIKVTVGTSKQITFAANVSLLAGAAGDGASGGNGGANSTSDNTAVLGQAVNGTGGSGKAGGNGGDGGKGGDVELHFLSDVVTFNTNLTMIANEGGKGADGTTGLINPGDKTNAGMDGEDGKGGQSGNGGKGGSVKIDAETIEFDNNTSSTHTFIVTSGAGGDDGTNLIANATAGKGGQGGDAEVLVRDNMEIKQDTALDFTKGLSAATASGGKLDIKVQDSLNIAEGKKATMTVTNAGQLVNLTDDIYFNTMEFQKNSTFTTDSELGALGTVGTGNIAYSVKNLLVHTNGFWNTEGAYMAGAVGAWSTFDMTDIRPDQVMLDMTSGTKNGRIDLDNFDLVKQHFDYRENAANSNAFIVSNYQLKQLNLGQVTLTDRTDGLPAGNNFWTNPIVDTVDGKGHAHYNDQDQANWFRYDAGLRAYYWDVYVDTNDPNNPLMADNWYTADGYKTFLQGYLAGVSSLNQTFWNTTEPLIREAAAAPIDTTVLSFKVGGSSVETDTGSNVDVDNFSASLALSRRMCNYSGTTTIGLFGEYGHGSYDTYANIYRLGKLYGDGDVNHFGGGLFARHDFSQGTYLEASLRGGGLDNDYKLRRDSRFNRPYDHNWDSSSSYFGAHLGVGHQYDFNDQTMIDFYGKFLWTRTNSDTVKTPFETFHADSVDSIRHRIGARLNHTSESGLFKGYVGLAWEHEYDGEATGYVSGPGVSKDRIRNAPDLGGSSGFAEAGFSFKPDEGAMYSIDLGVFGLVGEQQGFGGSLGFKFEF